MSLMSHRRVVGLRCLVVLLAATVVSAYEKDPATRGDVLVCYQKYAAESTPSQVVLDMANWKESYGSKRDYIHCFSGGRGNHRNDFLVVPETDRVSMDWRVTVKVHQNETANIYEVTNARDEPIRFMLRGRGSHVVTDVPLPIRTVIMPRSSIDVLTVGRIPGQPVSSFAFEWRAEAARYWQAPSYKQVFSNGVTISVEHKRDGSYFSAFNDRKSAGDVVSIVFRIEAMDGTDPKNLDVPKKDGSTLAIKPGQHKRNFFVVKPRDINKPWNFMWEYKWVSGGSPKELFGVSS